MKVDRLPIRYKGEIQGAIAIFHDTTHVQDMRKKLEEDPEGKHVKDVIENTRLHIILESGENEVGDIQIINGKKMIAMRIPIKKQGIVVGAIGKVMFRDISELTHFSKKSTVLEKELNIDGPIEKERTAKYSFKSLIGESENVIERAINLLDTDSMIKAEHLPDHMGY